MLETIQQLAKKEPKNPQEMGLKLCEEAGEVAQAILSYTQTSGNQYKQLSSEDVKEECIDTMLVAASLYFKMPGSSKEELMTILETKMGKWERYMEK